jgi:hypothetical protein
MRNGLSGTCELWLACLFVQLLHLVVNYIIFQSQVLNFGSSLGNISIEVS